MVSKCVNEHCGRPFHYFTEGKLFVANIQKRQSVGGRLPVRTEYFWLCDTCSQKANLEIYLRRLDTSVRSVVQLNNHEFKQLKSLTYEVSS